MDECQRIALSPSDWLCLITSVHYSALSLFWCTHQLVALDIWPTLFSWGYVNPSLSLRASNFALLASSWRSSFPGSKMIMFSLTVTWCSYLWSIFHCNTVSFVCRFHCLVPTKSEGKTFPFLELCIFVFILAGPFALEQSFCFYCRCLYAGRGQQLLLLVNW